VISSKCALSSLHYTTLHAGHIKCQGLTIKSTLMKSMKHETSCVPCRHNGVMLRVVSALSGAIMRDGGDQLFLASEPGAWPIMVGYLKLYVTTGSRLQSNVAQTPAHGPNPARDKSPNWPAKSNRKVENMKIWHIVYCLVVWRSSGSSFASLSNKHQAGHF